MSLSAPSSSPTTLSSSSSRAVSMMIGTVLCAQPAAHLEPVELRQHEVEDDEVDPLVPKRCEGLLAVPRLHDPEALALERVREQLLHRILVVDEEDGRGFRHRRFHVELAAGRVLL